MIWIKQVLIRISSLGVFEENIRFSFSIRIPWFWKKNQTEQTVNSKKSGFRAAPFTLSLFAKFYQLSKIILESQNWLSLKGKNLKISTYGLQLFIVHFFVILHYSIYHLHICMSCLDHPNCFGWVQIVLVGSKSFWSGSNQIFLDYFL